MAGTFAVPVVTGKMRPLPDVCRLVARYIKGIGISYPGYIIISLH